MRQRRHRLRRGLAWGCTFVASLELAKQGDLTLAQDGALRPDPCQTAVSAATTLNSAGPDLVNAHDEQVPQRLTAPAGGYRGSPLAIRQVPRRGLLSDRRVEDAGGATANSGRICCQTKSHRTSTDHLCHRQGPCTGPCARPLPLRHVHPPNTGLAGLERRPVATGSSYSAVTRALRPTPAGANQRASPRFSSQRQRSEAPSAGVSPRVPQPSPSGQRQGPTATPGTVEPLARRTSSSASRLRQR